MQEKPMWRTPLGDRVLRGEEGRLLQNGLGALVDRLDEMGGDHGVGVGVFDGLSLPERLAVLEQVGRALLLEVVPCPELTAVVEGAVAAVYAQVLIDLEAEIDQGQDQVRRLIRAAAEASGVPHEDAPALDYADVDEWSEVLDALTDNTFWDRDWDEQNIDPDNPPELADFLRGVAGITLQYYTNVAPDPPPGQIQGIRGSFHVLCRMER
jgi:hypothetical protein